MQLGPIDFTSFDVECLTWQSLFPPGLPAINPTLFCVYSMCCLRDAIPCLVIRDKSSSFLGHLI